MRITFWGTRGSCPTPGQSTARYGGNTTCLEVRADDGALLVFDAGTGIRELGRSLVGNSNGDVICGDIFFSHMHWDHIQGLPFFTPAFQEGNQFTLWGGSTLMGSLEVVLRQQMSPVVFPVPFDALSARMEVRELASNRFSANAVDVRAIDVRHPGGALGFRVTPRDRPRTSFVFIPDNELDPSFENSGGRTASRAEMVEFARGTKFLIHDAMYTGADYMAHRGWGHSSYRDAVEFAIAAEAETLVLFHHDPERTDESLDAQLALCRSMVVERDGTLQVMAATEGTVLEI